MSTSTHTKRIVIIAGPNGAGKTTFAREYLPTDVELPNFVNADLIAAGLSPFAPGNRDRRGIEQMKSVAVSHLNDADLQKVPQALLRAAEKARQLAEQTGIPFVVRKSAKPTAAVKQK